MDKPEEIKNRPIYMAETIFHEEYGYYPYTIYDITHDVYLSNDNFKAVLYSDYYIKRIHDSEGRDK